MKIRGYGKPSNPLTLILNNDYSTSVKRKYHHLYRLKIIFIESDIKFRRKLIYFGIKFFFNYKMYSSSIKI